MRIYNTLSGTKSSCDPGPLTTLRVYVCGPTVYDYAHLGHVRCYTVYDVLVRYLRRVGFSVKYVRNITDIDDKIIKRAQERSMNPLALAEEFTRAFSEDMHALNNLLPDVEPKVSDHLEEIRNIIDQLVEKEFAYVAEGDVYFSIDSKPDYGKLSKRKIVDTVEGASGRLDVAEQQRKRAPGDFALWKQSERDSLGWPAPSCVKAQWPDAKGRPGWHIECSAMSLKHLGETLDIHGGGLDLVFPHHENELAQSEALTGKPFVNCWMHNGFVEVDKEKMSKSLGNFFTARQIFELYDPEVIRYAMLGMHYRSPLNLEWTLNERDEVSGFPLFEEAENRLEYFYNTQARVSQWKENLEIGHMPIAEGLNRALEDDLNTPLALSWMSEFLRGINELCDQVDKRKAQLAEAQKLHAVAGLSDIQTVLGVGTQSPPEWLEKLRAKKAKRRGLNIEEIDRKVNARNQARAEKDFSRADALRAELDAVGVEIMDTGGQSRWRMK